LTVALAIFGAILFAAGGGRPNWILIGAIVGVLIERLLRW